MGNNRLPLLAAAPYRPAPPVQQPRAPVERSAALAALQRHWMAAPRLETMLAPQRNGIGALRLALAFCVLLSNAVWLYTANPDAQPLMGFAGTSLATLAVQGLLVLAGLLSARSLCMRRDLAGFARARILGLAPAFVVCTLVLAFAMGPALTTYDMAGYFHSSALLSYLFGTLTLATGTAALPGVFAFNPVAGLLDAPLSIAKYWVGCLVALGLLWAVADRVRPSRRVVVALVAAWAAGMVVLGPTLHHATGFTDKLLYHGLFFGTGVAAYLMRRSIRVSWLVLLPLMALFYIAHSSDLIEVASAALVGYVVLWLASFRFGAFGDYCRENDYTLGVYLYSFPVTQALLVLWPGVGLLALLGAAAGATLVAAFLSSELVERPARRWLRPSLAPAPVVRPATPPPASVPVAKESPAQSPRAAVSTSPRQPDERRRAAETGVAGAATRPGAPAWTSAGKLSRAEARLNRIASR